MSAGTSAVKVLRIFVAVVMALSSTYGRYVESAAAQPVPELQAVQDWLNSLLGDFESTTPDRASECAAQAFNAAVPPNYDPNVHLIDVEMIEGECRICAAIGCYNLLPPLLYQIAIDPEQLALASFILDWLTNNCINSTAEQCENSVAEMVVEARFAPAPNPAVENEIGVSNPIVDNALKVADDIKNISPGKALLLAAVSTSHIWGPVLIRLVALNPLVLKTVATAAALIIVGFVIASSVDWVFREDGVSTRKMLWDATENDKFGQGTIRVAEALWDDFSYTVKRDWGNVIDWWNSGSSTPRPTSQPTYTPVPTS